MFEELTQSRVYIGLLLACLSVNSKMWKYTYTSTCQNETEVYSRDLLHQVVLTQQANLQDKVFLAWISYLHSTNRRPQLSPPSYVYPRYLTNATTSQLIYRAPPRTSFWGGSQAGSKLLVGNPLPPFSRALERSYQNFTMEGIFGVTIIQPRNPAF